MKKVFLLLAIIILSSCSKEEIEPSCETQVRLIIESYNPLLQPLLDPEIPFIEKEWDVIFELIDAQQAEIDALNCNE